AEDGIREFHVTGVQTCALPISTSTRRRSRFGCRHPSGESVARKLCLLLTVVSPPAPCGSGPRKFYLDPTTKAWVDVRDAGLRLRSEERRVGKAGGGGRARARRA